MTQNANYGTMLLRTAISVVLVALFFSLWAEWAEACPTCKDGISANSTEQSQIVQGYFWSILFMMGMPFVILGTLSSCMYVSVRRARRQQAAEADSSAAKAERSAV